MRLSTVVRSISSAVRVRLDPSEIPHPPQRLVARIGRGDYRAVGRDLCRVVIDEGGLRPDHRVLDIGCGVGRLAAPLTRYLSEGTYDGFDIDPELVAWCRDNITRRHPRFRFRHVDVVSGFYNPSGAVEGAAFSFPYDDGAFTCVVATSLFTHLLTGDAANYLREAGRVLAPGGTLVATFFLLDEWSEATLATGVAQIEFTPAGSAPQGHTAAQVHPAAQVHRVQRSDKPEAAVAYPADWIRQRLQEAGFASPIRFAGGGWCGRPDPCTYQDVVIARKA
jgi:SAM-dependent methyltransferase